MIHTAIEALTAVGQRWTIARGIVKTLWIKIKDAQLEEKLFDSTITLLKLNAVENWGLDDHLLFESCMYPNYTNGDVRDITRVGEILAMYAQLDINQGAPP